MSIPPTTDIWKYKPWWCQPWTVLLTGTGVIIGSWLLFHRIWLTAMTSLFILMWWFYFLIFIPYLFKQQSLNREQ
ncbi:hypothetical protein RGRSB_0830 [cyanobacterium endosymbiont of Rhopalodia gibberula]|uniref:DUF6737 family protein n=1 Tax=cyanobacterium endosymbiont of Rhopalodia gibberula TaxID=1763363 RepID=UPI000DC6E92A|nr:DUF6737 family protein [cyanobacterium endosymbiont of Rhopalodia gibberula]BBA79358.1 hypothetical protein RGRSB_0830 [cyanobacterium endosymbiont of Rhopalodia gibberula]